MMLKAVQFGAGSIGRGFLGQLLFEGSFQTTFVDTNAALVNALEARGSYPLRLIGAAGTQNLSIGNLLALLASDTEKIIQAITEANLLSTAVGVAALPHIAPVIAAGLNARAAAGGGPINLLLCENQWHAATLMRELLIPHLTSEALVSLGSQVGLVETVIGRMVPLPTEALRTEDPLLVVAEPYRELPVARSALRGPTPRLPGLLMAENFEAYEARKLLLHNMSHAALAYLGAPRGHTLIWQCAADSEIGETVSQAINDVCRALVLEYGFGPSTLAIYAEDLLSRFTNRALGDTVSRVAADPLRKLRPEDRLIGAASLCLKHGIPPHALVRVIRASLAYDNPDDPSAVRLQEMRKLHGDAGVMEAVCCLTPNSELTQMIVGGRDVLLSNNKAHLKS